jgi:hypothetical protein
VSCPPGTTMLGPPLRVEEVGDTHITADVFLEYLRTHAQDRYKMEIEVFFLHRNLFFLLSSVRHGHYLRQSLGAVWYRRVFS